MNGTRRINSQVLVMPDGTIAGRYDKVRRVPFGEYVPLRGLLEAVGAPVEQIGTRRRCRHRARRTSTCPTARGSAS